MVWEKTRESHTVYQEIHSPFKGDQSPGCSLEGLMLKLKLHTLPPHGKVDSLESCCGGSGGKKKGRQES